MTVNRPKARLFVADDLGIGATLVLDAQAAHHIGVVLRLGSGERITVFNDRDGEWVGRITAASRRGVAVTVETMMRPLQPEPGPWLAFAPLKKGALDVLVEKATELGVERLIPVLTARTVVARVNIGRLRAQVREAAEQCERLTIPDVAEPVAIARFCADWPRNRRLWILDERGGGEPVQALVASKSEQLAENAPGGSEQAAAGLAPGFLVGPEGGFALSELDDMVALPFVSRVSLGPRILRAETAALAALASWQALAGDSTHLPPPRPDGSGRRI